ncbi:hypothetical protein Cst_c14470 [Thermoclostridium stercorarium subsp. stercorarium DSM 8532]|uniref:Uncharacterized protein n=1 Tax=Thermoclostridium stercorarium (strain ATCC 35414 / DSM 8532 / NCIMB 11754) TaxID=1121335 RepID=L7VNS8_THES1|nr:hypothetical protein Cst_c14470 [Thermoclostridium stercorarium subsp. stercorarium DSM 8532]
MIQQKALLSGLKKQISPVLFRAFSLFRYVLCYVIQYFYIIV